LNSQQAVLTLEKHLSTTTEETEQPHKPRPTQSLHKPQHSHIPTFFYSCESSVNKLHRVKLLTGKPSKHEVPDCQFKRSCTWSELPGGSLLIAGGEGVRDVVQVDNLREYAVSAHQEGGECKRLNPGCAQDFEEAKSKYSLLYSTITTEINVV
jgi:hypothetical protein